MSYQSQHQYMKPVLDLARQLDIATNPDPSAIFEPGSGGFQVWCTPTDRPQGWNGITMNAGAFAKPCEYVGSVLWKWDDEQIVALEIQTSAYALADQKPGEYCNLQQIPAGLHRRTIFNREADIEWLKEKITWLFWEAGVPLPPFAHEATVSSRSESFILTHYTSEAEEYVVIVSPEKDPEEFCRIRYRIAATLEIWNVGDFPVDVILRPDGELFEDETEPDEGPLVEQYENASRLQDDDWLEARLESLISDFDE
jgi:hypothetical protein